VNARARDLKFAIKVAPITKVNKLLSRWFPWLVTLRHAKVGKILT